MRPLVALLEVAVLRTLTAGGRPVEARHALGEARAVQAGAGVAVTCKGRSRELKIREFKIWGNLSSYIRRTAC